jgi:hypothetical protein
VKNIEVKTSSKRVIVECTARRNFALEEQAVNKKKGMFEKFFKRKLLVVWKQL